MKRLILRIFVAMTTALGLASDADFIAATGAHDAAYRRFFQSVPPALR